MGKILVVDDQRIFLDREGMEIVHTETSQDGYAAMLMDGPWDEIWLDHDLGMESKGSGYDLAQMIVDHIDGWGDEGVPEEEVAAAILNFQGRVYVHSMNPVGADRMVQTLTRYFDVARIDPTPYMDFNAMHSQGRNPYLAGPRR